MSTSSSTSTAVSGIFTPDTGFTITSPGWTGDGQTIYSNGTVLTTTTPKRPEKMQIVMDHAAAGTLVNGSRLKDFKVFKSGTFKDSARIERTWTDDDLKQMVGHFGLLRGLNIVPNVPVRKNHGRSIDDVIGYIESLTFENGYLLADIVFTEPDAANKFERGTFRNRSLEVGGYETNDESFYYPTVLGLAFVDLPAVEGLFNQGNEPVTTILLEDYEMADDNSSTDDNDDQETQDQDWLAAASYAQGLEDAARNFAPKTFTVNGASESNYTAVQAHIEQLEAFRTESISAGRTGFVDQLVAGNKLPAPQAETMKTLVETFTSDQFDAFKASYEAAPANTLFEKHGDGEGTVTNPDGDTDTDPAKDQYEVDAEVVSMHKKSGMPEEQIHNTDSYKRMVAFEQTNGGN